MLSATLGRPPGSICSHITSFSRGYKDQRFSLEEQSPLFRCRLQMYDTTDLDSAANWWKHKSLEMDVGYVENSPLQKTLHRIVNHCWKNLQKRSKFGKVCEKTTLYLKRYYPVPCESIRTLLSPQSSEFDMDFFDPQKDSHSRRY
ncbi:hypothetical protein JTE90_002485 [Oedothorax gibbosus]|uniref:Uncharacterized protein n=1 Tax=Oedothorax gibbosus TaxID=931172 RepID=A0AAV6TTQ6_9ARAC|nr:hypothetical protein JTE90_002485 [Oedothorax gibbosus]